MNVHGGGRRGGRRGGGWGRKRFGPRYRHFGGYGGYGYGYPYLYSAPYYYDYDDATPSPNEPNWVGKKLIRRGQTVSEEDQASQNFVLEDNIPTPYAIIGPGAPTPGGYVSNRLLLYIDQNNLINSVVYS